MIPRFFGPPLVHRWMAEVQFWAAQAGLLGLSAVAAACFVVTSWRTMNASAMCETNARGRAVPVMPPADAH